MYQYRDNDLEERRDFVLGVGIFALAAVVFLPTAGYGFVNWDDPWYVLQNPTVKSWSAENLYALATTVQVRNFAPLTMLSFLVDYTLWGAWAGGYHITNAWLHALNAALVFGLLRQLGASRFPAVLAACLFAAHPVQVESVAWISARKGLLSGTFILLSLRMWLRPERTTREEGYGILFLALALLSKAIAVVVPPVVLAYDLLVRKRDWGSSIARQILPGFLACMLLAVTMSAQTSETGGVRDHLALGRGYLLLLDATLLWRYVAHLFVPTNLSVLYDPPTTGVALEIGVSIAGWLAVGALAFSWRERQPWIAFGLLVALLFLLPVLNLFPLTTLMNDRYLYLPSIPLFALFATGLDGLVRAVCGGVDAERTLRQGFRRFAAAGLFGAVGLCCVVGAVRRTQEYLPVWKSDLGLWEHAREQTPRLTVVRIQLAIAYHRTGRLEEAIDELRFAEAETSPDAADLARIDEKLKSWRAELAERQAEPPSIAEAG